MFKEKWLRVLSVQHYLTLAAVSLLDHLRQFLMASELFVTLQTSQSFLFVKHFAIDHTFSLAIQLRDYTHSTDKTDR